MIMDRRNERSDNMKSALEFQLAASVRRGEFDSIVLADDAGLVVAAAGAGVEQDAMAALSPRLAGKGLLWHGQLSSGEAAQTLTVKPFVSQDGPLYLCARGGILRLVSEELHQSSRGVCRILAQ